MHIYGVFDAHGNPNLVYTHWLSIECVNENWFLIYYSKKAAHTIHGISIDYTKQ